MKTTIIKKQPESVVDKIRVFRDEFTRNYLRKHKKFNIYSFTQEFLQQPERLKN